MLLFTRLTFIDYDLGQTEYHSKVGSKTQYLLSDCGRVTKRSVKTEKAGMEMNIYLEWKHKLQAITNFEKLICHKITRSKKQQYFC